MFDFQKLFKVLGGKHTQLLKVKLLPELCTNINKDNMRIIDVTLMNDSSHFKYLYANTITFCRFWHITGEILNLLLTYLTAHFMTKYLILLSFPPYFLRNVNIFFSHRGKRKAHLCSLVLSVSSLKT